MNSVWTIIDKLFKKKIKKSAVTSLKKNLIKNMGDQTTYKTAYNYAAQKIEEGHPELAEPVLEKLCSEELRKETGHTIILKIQKKETGQKKETSIYTTNSPENSIKKIVHRVELFKTLETTGFMHKKYSEEIATLVERTRHEFNKIKYIGPTLRAGKHILEAILNGSTNYESQTYLNNKILQNNKVAEMIKKEQINNALKQLKQINENEAITKIRSQLTQNPEYKKKAIKLVNKHKWLTRNAKSNLVWIGERADSQAMHFKTYFTDYSSWNVLSDYPKIIKPFIKHIPLDLQMSLKSFEKVYTNIDDILVNEDLMEEMGGFNEASKKIKNTYGKEIATVDFEKFNRLCYPREDLVIFLQSPANLGITEIKNINKKYLETRYNIIDNLEKNYFKDKEGNFDENMFKYKGLEDSLRHFLFWDHTLDGELPNTDNTYLFLTYLTLSQMINKKIPETNELLLVYEQPKIAFEKINYLLENVNKEKYE